MGKISRFKRALACAVSAATLFSCASVNVANYSAVVAADGQNYAEALAMSLYFFDANQCGTEVDDNPLTWRGNCHTYDAEASLDNANGLSSSSKSFIKNANGGSDKVDVSGGYHDAGDHIKFSKTMGFAGASLAWSYFTYPDSYKKAGCEDHLFDILKENADYMMKTTYLDGNDVVAFCYIVGDEGSDHGVWSAPETQTMTRNTYWADSSHPDGCSAGLMAASLASTSLALKNVAPEYAAECLKYAKALEAFAKKYPTPASDGYGGMYQNSNSASDEIAFGEVWCALAENNGSLPSSYTATYKWNGESYNGEWDGWLYTWDKAWSGYAALLTEVGYETSTYMGALKKAYDGRGGLSTSRYCADGWGASRYNCALQNSALHLAKANNDQSYAEAAKYQMDFILGNNPSGKSFLLGYGTQWPTKIHHRAANVGSGSADDNSDATYTLYGALIGGPNSNGEYEDKKNSYSCTEPALDYNGCFALACAGLVDYYGGDASDLDSIVKNADEINSDYEFGKWYKGDQPVVTTTVTTEPTETTTTTVVTTVTTTEPTEETTASETSTTPETSVTTTETTETTSENPVQPTKYGDIDCDDIITATDIVLLNKYILSSTEYDLKPVAKANADCNIDGVIDLKDSNMLIGVVIGTFSESDLGKAVN